MTTPPASTPDKVLDLLHAITQAAIAAGGMTVTLRFGADDTTDALQADIEELAEVITENDRAASAVVSQLEQEQQQDRARLTEMSASLVRCEGPCGGSWLVANGQAGMCTWGTCPHSRPHTPTEG